MASTAIINSIKNSYRNFVFKFGRKSGVGVDPLVVYTGGTPYTGWLANEAQVVAVSTSDDDKEGGGGAKSITVIGQGNAGLEMSDDIILNGTTESAPSLKKFNVIYRMYVKDTEDFNEVTGPNHGEIKVYQLGDILKTCAYIEEAAGQTLMCIYRVPSNKYAELINIGLSASEGKSSIIYIKVREGIDKPWRVKGTFSNFENAIELSFKKPKLILPGSDVIAIVISSAAGSNIDANFELELKDIPEE